MINNSQISYNQNNMIKIDTIIEKYYLKKIFYGNYVKNILLPLENINTNIGNKDGIKNTGKNDKKLLNSRIRTQGNFIRRAYQNFYDCKTLSFLTLTYAVNETDIKKCKYDLKKFFQNVQKQWWDKRFKKPNEKSVFKYTYTYEYQKRGAVHFHIIFSQKVPNWVVLKYWKYGINKNIKVRKGTNEDVVKYIGKYIVKTANDNKSQNHYDLNIKAYQFSKNCTKPKIKVGVVEISHYELMRAIKDTTHYFKFGDKNGVLIGVSTDSYLGLDRFREYKEYVSADRKIFNNQVKNTDFTIKKRC